MIRFLLVLILSVAACSLSWSQAITDNEPRPWPHDHDSATGQVIWVVVDNKDGFENDPGNDPAEFNNKKKPSEQTKILVLGHGVGVKTDSGHSHPEHYGQNHTHNDLIDSTGVTTGGQQGGTTPTSTTKKQSATGCGVGWVRTLRSGDGSPRIIISAVELELLKGRLNFRVIAIEITKHSDVEYENLDGWKLETGVIYNHRDSHTLDNTQFEGNTLRIVSDVGKPFRVGVATTSYGQDVPGFDYRLYDDNGQKIDFGISCYADVVRSQWLRIDPKVYRRMPTDSDWLNADDVRSEWYINNPNAPASPTAVRHMMSAVTGKSLTPKGKLPGIWANLKREYK